MSQFFITYTGRSGRHGIYGPETREGSVPTKMAKVVDDLVENLDGDETINEVKVIEVLDGGMWSDVSKLAVDVLREHAFDHDLDHLLEHEIVHPHGFCYDCYTMGAKCESCKYEAARDACKEDAHG